MCVMGQIRPTTYCTPPFKNDKDKRHKKPTVRSVLLEKRVDDTEEELGQAFEEREENRKNKGPEGANCFSKDLVAFISDKGQGSEIIIG